MEINKTKTQRGFSLIEFSDLYGVKCDIQKSSLATDDAIWFGVENVNPQIMASKVIDGGTGWIPYSIPEDVLLSTRMHLSRKQVKKLLPILKKFVRTGEI